MSTISRSPVAAVVALCLLVAQTSAWSGETTAFVQAPTRAPTNPLNAKPVDPQALAQQRGGSDAASLADVKLSGTVTNNSASNLTTGSNIITDGALAGASGVPMVIQNSGNNVLIQSATIINVTVK